MAQRGLEQPGAAQGDGGRISGTLIAPPVGQPPAYSDTPVRLKEHALLGTLLNSPGALADVAKFLHTRDFSSSELRATYAALKGLAEAGKLREVALFGDPASQYRAAYENQQMLFITLQDNRFNPNWRASQNSDIVPNPSRLVGMLVDAAPPEAVPYRGVYDPMAQMRLARDVLADAAKRRISTIAKLSRATAPLAPARPGTRDVRGINSLINTLGAASAEIATIAERWSSAAHRAGPDIVTGTPATALAAEAAGARRPPRQGIIGTIAASRARRAEIHLIHVALHGGPNLEPDLDAGLFSSPETANTWRMIQELRDRGEPVHYASLFGEKHGLGAALGPALSDKQIIAMAAPPNLRPDRIANSLRTVVTAGLRHATKDTQAALTAAATNRAVPAEGLLHYAADKVTALAGLADNAGAQHRHITALQAQPGRSNPR